jgi:pyridoxamine 5'-phosphate oxidase
VVFAPGLESGCIPVSPPVEEVTVAETPQWTEPAPEPAEESPGIDPRAEEPMVLFTRWLGWAEAVGGPGYPRAMTLSTVDEEGWPDARIVLLEEYDPGGLVFFTDRESKKARDLRANPRAAVTFHWQALERQVRIRGTVAQAQAGVADRCFARRPRPSRLTAWVCRQGRELGSRRELLGSMAACAERFQGVEDIPRPETWTAWRLEIAELELWRARARRLHDRLLFRRTASGWLRTWLEP